MKKRADTTAREENLDRKWENALRDLEGQAHALFSAQEQIEQLERTGSLDLLLRLSFGELRSSTRLPPLPPVVEKADWARSNQGSVSSETLNVYPGHGSAVLQTVPHTTIGYVIEGSDVARIISFVRSVYLAQRDRRNFSPVFITSCDRFDPFIANNYIFEYVPSREKFAVNQERYDEWRRKRLAHITAKWGISEFITYDSEATLDIPKRRGGKPHLVVFPDYGRTNPYIEMMYSKLVDGLEMLFGDPRKAVELARSGPVIFHLHWEDAVIRTLREDDVPSAMADFVTAIDEMKALGGIFVWTIHNLDPHDVGEKELGIEFSRQLYLRADRIHTHDQRTAALLRVRFRLDKDIVVIEHPSYRGYYPEKLDKELARRSLGIGLEDDDEVFLWFGQVRRYKGIAALLNVAPGFKERAKFIFAGRSGRYDPRSSPPGNCISIDGHIDDNRLSALFSAADFAVLPFEEITASGSLMLAMSYALPVIAPEYDAISNIVRDGREGFLYRPDDDSRSLSATIERALETPQWLREAMGLSTSAVAASRPPEAFASAVRRVLEEALNAARLISRIDLSKCNTDHVGYHSEGSQTSQGRG